MHPGYGFLAESAALARACEEAGIQFVGPTPAHLDMFGDKTAAKARGDRRRCPDRTGLRRGAAAVDRRQGGGRARRLPADDQGELRRRRPRHARGRDGGGAREQARRGAARGGRRVRTAGRVPRALHLAREAHRGAGARRRARQPGAPLGARLLGAAAPSEGRRGRAEHHAAAGAPNGDLRDARPGCAARLDTAAPGRSSSCSTWTRGEFFFIEVNPRIQVEHTVTEMVTGIDLVRSQILVADGHALHEPPIGIPRQDDDRDAAAWRCSAGSRPRILSATSSPTTVASRPIDRPAASPSGSTAATASAGP